ncbi:MAG: EscU/YscU/HrcU family type III secretion system export apparatus switch protein, partial [Actinomycetes bacterium]
MAGDKTEKATPQRRKESRRKGTVNRSTEPGVWLALLVGAELVRLTVSTATGRLTTLLVDVATVIRTPDPHLALRVLGQGLTGAAVALVPLAVGMPVLGVALAAVQGGIRFSTHGLAPQWSHLNPAKGLKRTLGPQGWWEGAKSLLKTVVIATVAYGVGRSVVPRLAGASAMPLGQALGLVAVAGTTLVRAVAGAGLLLALADYAVTRYRTE